MDAHMNQIIESITSLLSETLTIIIYGSYGRNEGGWYNTIEDGYQPFNDYDIILIKDNKIPTTILSSLKKKLLEKINIKWIDLSQMTTVELTKLEPSIFNYDLKYGSNVIYGDLNVLDLIPRIEAKDIPLEDGNILFKTRMWSFFGSLDETSFDRGVVGEDSRFFRNQMAKAVLSIVDVCLLQKGAYHYSYKQRVSSFKKLYSHKKELCALSEWALSEKLEPKAPEMSKYEVESLYSNVHFYFLKEMFIVLSKRFKTIIRKPEKLILLWHYHPLILFKRVAYFLYKRSMNFEDKIKIDIVQLYLISAYKKGSINRQYLTKANYLMKELDPSVSQNLSWDKARLIVAKMRLN